MKFNFDSSRWLRNVHSFLRMSRFALGFGWLRSHKATYENAQFKISISETRAINFAGQLWNLPFARALSACERKWLIFFDTAIWIALIYLFTFFAFVPFIFFIRVVVGGGARRGVRDGGVGGITICFLVVGEAVLSNHAQKSKMLIMIFGAERLNGPCCALCVMDALNRDWFLFFFSLYFWS